MDEIDLIETYIKPLARSSRAFGLTDDVAQLGSGDRPAIVTCDAILEGVHFLPGDRLDTVAQKLVRVNVSDIYAKGALPEDALLVLGWPSTRAEGEVSDFARGLGEALETFGIHLIGGDTVTSPVGLFLSLTLTGRCLGETPILRSGAKAGDDIWVSGEIGHGAVGLADAKDGRETPAAQRYRVPEIAPLAIAELVARFANASMDISDGLIGDAQRLLAASGSGGRLELGDVPIARASESYDGAIGQLTGGDDYQVLLAAPAAARHEIERFASERGAAITRIGAVEAATDLRLFWYEAQVEAPDSCSYRHS